MTERTTATGPSQHKERLTGLIDQLRSKDMEIVAAYSAINEAIVCGSPEAGALHRRIAAGELLHDVDPDVIEDGRAGLSETQIRRMRRLARHYVDFRRKCIVLLTQVGDGDVRFRRGYRRVSRDVVDLVCCVEDMKSDVWDVYASTDELTGLLTRTALDRIVAEEIGRAPRSARPMCVAIADVDHFKAVNDSYGHPTGDAVLVELAHRIDGNLRAHDHVIRFGGEEILILMPRTEPRNARRVLERVRRRIEEAPVPTLSGGELWVTVSIGYARMTLGDTFKAVLDRADDALYAAKASGRNRVVRAGASASPGEPDFMPDEVAAETGNGSDVSPAFPG